MGRPRIRPRPTDEGILDRICEGLARGEDIRSICKPQTMPNFPDVYVEMARNEAFAKSIARAREAQQEAVVDEMIALADGATVEDWQVVKLQIWARQWRASKLAPKKYGVVKEGTEQASGGVTVVGGLPKDSDVDPTPPRRRNDEPDE